MRFHDRVLKHRRDDRYEINQAVNPEQKPVELIASEHHSDIPMTRTVFFLELQTQEGDYVTIRRSAQNHSKVSLKQLASRRQWHDEQVFEYAARGVLVWSGLIASMSRSRPTRISTRPLSPKL
jgi:hypothetical protein